MGQGGDRKAPLRARRRVSLQQKRPFMQKIQPNQQSTTERLSETRLVPTIPARRTRTEAFRTTQHQLAAHHHDRGPDRIPAPRHQLPRDAARTRTGKAQSGGSLCRWRGRAVLLLISIQQFINLLYFFSDRHEFLY